VIRNYLHIDLAQQSTRTEQLEGVALVRAGRCLIARTLVDRGIAAVDPLSADNPLIFSAGPFAGTNFSNANRTSVGCRSPLTGGVKEANAGGTFSVALGQTGIAGMTLCGAAAEWTVIHISRDGALKFESAADLLRKGNFEAAALLHDRYGKKVSIALCGPVGEYCGLLAGIAFSDTDRRPSRMAARGGVGAVMGSKRVKAIVVETDRMPPLHDRKKVIQAVRRYAEKLNENEIIASFREVGTAAMADTMNHMGGLPVRNFSAGRLVDTKVEPLKMGGTYIRELNTGRGGLQAHACMPGCVIQCSNVYAGADGKEIVSPVEYETLGLMGTNCGLTDPDDLARLNAVANDLGVDSIETGATIAVLMEAGLGEFGDAGFMHRVLDEIRHGTDEGRLWAQGTARVGRHYGVTRVPVIKSQAISAYDPRVVEVTGISMMMTAQGADHTTGNVPYLATHDKEAAELVEASLQAQIDSAAFDSIGLCIFGRAVSTPNLDLITSAINDAVGTALEPSFFRELGRDTLRLENDFNRAAGFTVVDDELPEFFYDEALAPTGRRARFHGTELKAHVDSWWRRQQDAAG
jgi:aldehyde:ferredoxin oxidoreductase